MKGVLISVAAAALLALTACSDEGPTEAPAPFALTAEAMGHYCGMNVLEHPGPKGQIVLGRVPEPIWFSSARDAVAFTMLPEEPKDIAAIFVSDMGAAQEWKNPGAENWIDARGAFYVIGSSAQGGMGAPETVPFSTLEAAEKFANENGGNVVTFEEIPSSYVLGSGGKTNPEEDADQMDPEP